jgi:hypothetical protein
VASPLFQLSKIRARYSKESDLKIECGDIGGEKEERAEKPFYL